MSKNKLILNKVPIVIKKGSNFTINQQLFRDTIIYDSKEMNYFKEKYERVTLFNRQNILTNSCRLIAKIGTLNGEIQEKTSDGIVKMIGQDQFEVLFMALCSIINQEIRIRGLISILTTNKPENSEQNDVTDLRPKKKDVWSQTDETRIDKVNLNKKRRIRRHLAPYVVQDYKIPEKIKKVVVDITNYTTKSNSGTSNSNESKEMPDLGYLHDDDSNNTVLSTLTCESTPELLNDPLSMLKVVDNCTDKEIIHENHLPINENHENSIKIMNLDNESHELITNDTTSIETIQHNGFNLLLPDNTSVMLPAKPEDHFHIATEENLKVIDGNSRRKLVEIQRIIDLKFCLTPVDDEGNLPIHMAVMNEDLHLLKRQCFMLDLKETSVDIEANDLTPLKLSLFNESVSATVLLLSFGADPLLMDESHSTYFHTAAGLNTEHLSVLLHYCKNNARLLISENEDLQVPGWNEKSDDELSSHLMDYICSITDSQGYTPLMIATNLGLYTNVRSLLTHSPTSIHTVSPTTGNTVLYLAVVAACNVAAERGNKSKLVDHFRQTIEILLDYGADPTIDNYSGSNISVLLTDFQCPELSMLIANRGPASKYNDTTGNHNSLMLIKDDDEGNIKKYNDKKTMQLKNFRKIKEKPVILESIVLKSNSDSVIRNESAKNHDSSNLSQIDSTKSFSEKIKIESDSIKNNDISNLSHTDSIKSYSNKIKIESDSIIITNNSTNSHLNSTKSEIISKLNENPSFSTMNILESNDKSIKITSNNIIVSKPDKIILTPNSSIKRIDTSIHSIEEIDSSINPLKKIESAVIIKETIDKLKPNKSQKTIFGNSIRNTTFADFDPKSIEMPSAIRFLYSPNSIEKYKRLQSIAPVVSIPNQSINRVNKLQPKSLAVTKAKPKVYIKKSIPSTKKSIMKKNDDDCKMTVPSKTYKRKISDSD